MKPWPCVACLVRPQQLRLGLATWICVSSGAGGAQFGRWCCGGWRETGESGKNKEIRDQTNVNTGLKCAVDGQTGERRSKPGRDGHTWHSSNETVCGIDQRCEGLLVGLYFFLVVQRARLQTGCLRVSGTREKGCGKSQAGVNNSPQRAPAYLVSRFSQTQIGFLTLTHPPETR
jgi:hypothetical protein